MCIRDSKTFNVFTIEELIAFGNQNPLEVPTVDKKAIWTLCYTSGTTGDPKGVMITQENFTAEMSCLANGGFNFEDGKEVCLSYLPLAHVAERLIYFGIFFYGGEINIFSS